VAGETLAIREGSGKMCRIQGFTGTILKLPFSRTRGSLAKCSPVIRLLASLCNAIFVFIPRKGRLLENTAKRRLDRSEYRRDSRRKPTYTYRGRRKPARKCLGGICGSALYSSSLLPFKPVCSRVKRFGARERNAAICCTGS
jgi:hypothetical protein